MNADGVRALIKSEVRKIGSAAAWAHAHDLSAAYVCDILAGRRDPGKSVLKVLDLEKIVTYRRKNGTAK